MDNSSFGELPHPVGDLCLVVKPAFIPRFYPVLQAGFYLRGHIGLSIGAFLRESLHLSDRYIEERINTVFLDNKPVDDLEAAMIAEDSTLALSSAMPGLVGATMRRKGFYASFRSSITHSDKEGASSVKEGAIRVKLFNLVMSELAPVLLKRGLYLPSPDLAEFLRSQRDSLSEGVKTARLDGLAVDPLALSEQDLGARAGWMEIRACESP